jgi:hypothetical protein
MMHIYKDMSDQNWMQRAVSYSPIYAGNTITVKSTAASYLSAFEHVRDTFAS